MSSNKEIATDKAAAAIGAYSQAIKTGDLVFTSGQLPLTPEGTIVSDDVGEQARQSMTNIKHILEAAGAEIGNLVKCTIFITRMADFPTVNEVYQSFLTEPFPARSTVAVAELPKGAKVEIEAVARVE
ncbi:MAG: RidA family protein [Spirochaetaceae bacterium]